jgi:hypothetical protein
MRPNAHKREVQARATPTRAMCTREVQRAIVLGERDWAQQRPSSCDYCAHLRSRWGGSFFMTVRYSADAATSRAACACAHRTRRVRATFRFDFLRGANIACGLSRACGLRTTQFQRNSRLLLLPSLPFLPPPPTPLFYSHLRTCPAIVSIQ